MANAYFPSAATVLPEWPLTLHGIKDERMYRSWYTEWYREHPDQEAAMVAKEKEGRGEEGRGEEGRGEEGREKEGREKEGRGEESEDIQEENRRGGGNEPLRDASSEVLSIERNSGGRKGGDESDGGRRGEGRERANKGGEEGRVGAAGRVAGQRVTGQVVEQGGAGGGDHGMEVAQLTVGLLVNILADREKEWAILPSTLRRVTMRSINSSSTSASSSSSSTGIRCKRNKCVVVGDSGGNGGGRGNGGGNGGGGDDGDGSSAVLTFTSLAIDMWMVPRGEHAKGDQISNDRWIEMIVYVVLHDT
jgi:hypothetical protein